MTKVSSRSAVGNPDEWIPAVLDLRRRFEEAESLMRAKVPARRSSPCWTFGRFDGAQSGHSETDARRGLRKPARSRERRPDRERQAALGGQPASGLIWSMNAKAGLRPKSHNDGRQGFGIDEFWGRTGFDAWSTRVMRYLTRRSVRAQQTRHCWRAIRRNGADRRLAQMDSMSYSEPSPFQEEQVFGGGHQVGLVRIRESPPLIASF